MEGKLKDGFVAELKSRCSFTQIASKYVELTKKGRTFWARCPFHYEKTPSFSIDEYEGFYHCFGCGESGDLITFVKKMEGLSFIEAIEFLAKSVGMEMQYDSEADMATIAEKNRLKKQVLKALYDTKEFYKQQIYEKTAFKAQQYLKDRKINKASLESFEIGYSPNFKLLVSHLEKLGYDNQTLLEAGVISESNGKPYDSLAERLIFPIYNAYGEVIGFSGRILDSSLDVAKYKNTRQTIVFDKSKAIFGLKQVNDAKRQERFNSLILAEGQIDVISLHQFGFQNAVATQGTALTEQHAQILRKVSENIYVCYDGDSAGQKATFRALDILEKARLKVKIINIPNGQDPDEFLKTNGREAYQRLIDNAEEVLDYKLRTLAQNSDMNSNQSRSEFLKKSIDLLKELPTLAEADVYVNSIAKYANVANNVVRESLNNAMSSLTKKKQAPQDLTQFAQHFTDAYQKADKIILASIIHKKDYINDDLNLSFVNTNYQRLLNLLVIKKENNQEFRLADVYDHFELDQDKDIQELVNYKFSQNEDQNKQEYFNALNVNRMRLLEIEIKDLETLYKNATDLSKRTELLVKIGNYSKELADLKSSFVN